MTHDGANNTGKRGAKCRLKTSGLARGRPFPVEALFWTSDEDNDWRLVPASDRTGSEGPLKVYELLQQALATLSEDERQGLELQDIDIAVVTPQSQVVHEVRRRYGHVEADRRSARRVDLVPGEAYIYTLV